MADKGAKQDTCELASDVEVKVQKISPEEGDLVLVTAEAASGVDVENLQKVLGDLPFRTVVCNFPVKMEKVSAEGVLKVTVEGPADMYAEEDIQRVAEVFKEVIESPVDGEKENDHV